MSDFVESKSIDGIYDAEVVEPRSS